MSFSLLVWYSCRISLVSKSWPTENSFSLKLKFTLQLSCLARRLASSRAPVISVPTVKSIVILNIVLLSLLFGPSKSL
jgi:hypothetical protein